MPETPPKDWLRFIFEIGLLFTVAFACWCGLQAVKSYEGAEYQRVRLERSQFEFNTVKAKEKVYKDSIFLMGLYMATKGKGPNGKVRP